ncbi:carbohydrate ABC transporter permease [Nocardiopsis baichengensis]|uniref:carbohydrate ABC transporter permease n=1 Tax=Nocardiopsis baichengensis TaxID=280240 RepID=UPI00034938EC|nr:sugar ABC transporter permease [Nocardiopsis baichengensis]
MGLSAPALRRPGGTAPGARRRALEPWMYLLPALAVLGALLVYPLYQLVLVSFYDYRQPQVTGAEPLRFIGLENYASLVSDPQFWEVLANTAVFAAACVLGTLAVGGGLAVLATRLSPWVRTLLFLAALGAWATPAVTGSAVWLFLFDPLLGPVNQALVAIGLEGFSGHSWTYAKWPAFGLVWTQVVWCSFPFVMVTLYAGIRAIPEEVIEAARLDGASTGRIARSVMLPMLRPAMTVVTVQSIIWDFKIFTQIYIMTGGGGIAGQNLVLNVYAYQQAFASSQYGLGSAIGVVTTVLLLLITLLYLRTLRRQGEVL